MSDQTDEEIVAQKLIQGNMSISQLFDYWHMKYGIPVFERDFAKDYFKKIEGKNEQTKQDC